METVRLDLKTCTGDATSCPVTNACRFTGAFASIIESVQPDVREDADFYADFAEKCADGTCPGQKVERFVDALQLVFDATKPRDI